VLHPETLEDFDSSVVEPDRQGQPVLVGGGAKERAGRLIKSHEVGESVELGLRIGEGVEGGDVVHERTLLTLMISHLTNSEFGIRNSESRPPSRNSQGVVGWEFRIPNSKFRIQKTAAPQDRRVDLD
jgi:hypothetical protein